MADQEFLASFGVEIDETGLLRLQEALTKNRVLADDLAAAFNRAQRRRFGTHRPFKIQCAFNHLLRSLTHPTPIAQEKTSPDFHRAHEAPNGA